MRLQLSLSTGLGLFVLLANASFLSPFYSALDAWDTQILSNETSHELLKRQSNACPSNYNACTNQGAPGLCCARNQACAADGNGNVACCPTRASCTGTITGVVTGGVIGGGGLATSTSASGLLAGNSSPTTRATSNGLVPASASSATSGGQPTSTGGFIIAASTTVATLGNGGGRNLPIVSLTNPLMTLK